MHYVHTEDKPVRDAAELVANRRLAITGASRSMGQQHDKEDACGSGKPAALPAGYADIHGGIVELLDAARQAARAASMR